MNQPADILCNFAYGKKAQTKDGVRTSTKDLDANQLERYPDSGHVFLASMDSAGVPRKDCTI